MNYGFIDYECKNDIDNTIDVERLQDIAERMDKIISELTKLKPYLENRKEHIKKHIVKKYCVQLWKRKTGVYRDTSFINGKYESDSITKEVSGSHYLVNVHEYIYDTSLIGTMSKDHFEADQHIITIPYINISGHSDYDYYRSKEFSWKKKDLAFQYVNSLCKEFNLKLRPSSEFSDIMNDECIFQTSRNNQFDVWKDSEKVV